MNTRLKLFAFCSILVTAPLTAQVSTTIYVSSAAVQAVEWSRDGTRLTFGDEEGILRVWDVAGDKEIKSLRSSAGSVNSVHWSVDGSTVSYGSGTDIGIWNYQTDSLRVLSDNDVPVEGIAWSPDEKKVACACGRGNIKSYRIWDAVQEQLLFVLDTQPQGSGCSNHQVVWDPDGSRIITAGSCGWEGAMYDPATGEFLGSLDTWFGNTSMSSAVMSMAYSPDGKQIATGHSFDYINISDSKSGKIKRQLHFDGMGYHNMLAWSPAGDIIVSGDQEGIMTIWSAKNGLPINTFRGHLGAIQGLAWNNNGTRLATVSADGAVKIWDATTLNSSVGPEAADAKDMVIFPNPVRNGLRMNYACATTPESSPSRSSTRAEPRLWSRSSKHGEPGTNRPRLMYPQCPRVSTSWWPGCRMGLL